MLTLTKQPRDNVDFIYYRQINNCTTIFYRAIGIPTMKKMQGQVKT